LPSSSESSCEEGSRPKKSAPGSAGGTGDSWVSAAWSSLVKKFGSSEAMGATAIIIDV